jgi:hypothetical protein
MGDILITFTLPDDLQSQQPLVDRAEEDLMCAICLYRDGACGYPPLLNICYLLLQGIEKWLKVFIAIQDIRIPTNQDIRIPIKGRDSHNLSRFFAAVAEHEPDFERIQKKIEEVEPELLSHKFFVDLRYNDTPVEVENYIQTLIPAAFDTRRVVKKFLKRRQHDPNQI